MKISWTRYLRRTISRTSTCTGWTPAGDLLEDHEKVIYYRTLNMISAGGSAAGQYIYRRIISKTSTGRASAGNLLFGLQQDIYCVSISRTGYLLADHQKDKRSTGWPSSRHLLADHQQDFRHKVYCSTISRTSTVGPSAEHLLEDLQLVWHLLENHHQDIYWKTIVWYLM